MPVFCRCCAALMFAFLLLDNASPASARVLINEIHYDPDPKTDLAEFVELYNSGSTAVNLSGWRLTGGVDYVIPNGTSIGPGQYVVIAQKPAVVFAKWSVNALGPWTGLLRNSSDEVDLLNAAGGKEDSVAFQLGFPWPTVGELPSPSIELIHWSFDSSLGGNWRGSVGGPTPGRQNSVFATNAPPQIRQVDHSPNQPLTGQPVTITAKITDPEGVASVSLEYQLVTPGNYIALTDAAYTNTWTVVGMNDAGQSGDERAGDSIYTAVLPGTLQSHRSLVRYRIGAIDGRGLSIRVPYKDDPQPNFAYYCYDGVPAWEGALEPGATPLVNFPTNIMRRFPAVQIIAKQADIENATWFSRYGGDYYLWIGTLVYDGKVYDHIHYRARGGVWRYAMVKNMWKIDLARGHYIQMHDDYGNKFNTTWTKLNLGACIQQADFGHRGEQGMFESVGLRLFNLAGVEAPKTCFLQLRVVDQASEAPSDQYSGDFWGLYLGVEQEDGRFLDEHNLPDGNFYKMEGGTGDLNNLGLWGPSNKSDLNSFMSSYKATSPAASEAWWRTNLLVANYLSYQTIVQAIHHYDICYDKNYFYYRNPITGLWSIHPWDLDLTWANNMYDSGCGGIDDLYYPVFGGSAYPAKASITQEYQNRVREILDLLFNSDQAWQMIDEYANRLRDPGGANSFLDADRFMWDFNPKMNDWTYTPYQGKAGTGRYYQWPYEPSVPKTFEGCVRLMKAYVSDRANILEDSVLDYYIPIQPTVTYTGPANYPLNRINLRSSLFAGAYPFAAMKWRVGEITLSNAPAFKPSGPRQYEIVPVWESELTKYASDVTVPASALKVGHAYRARVRMKDSSGRWSRWSAPLEFIVSAPDNAAALVQHLKITELMYEPPAGSDYEFIEFLNNSDSLTLDLGGARFTDGIDFSFPAGTTMLPGSYLVLVRSTNVVAFKSFYGLGAAVRVLGGYEGSFNNNGEQITLKVGAGGDEIASFSYEFGRGWPVAAKGAGHSLVPLPSALDGQATGALDYPGNWRASTFVNGSPGAQDPSPVPAVVLLNEIAAHTDYNDPARPEYDSDDWLELYNPADTTVDLSGYFLSDDPADPRKWEIPPSTIAGRGRLLLDEVHDFHNPITTGFGLDKAGEQLLLSYMPVDAPGRVVDAISYKGQENERSLSRFPDGGPWWYTTGRSSNSVNTAPVPGIRISEIMYHPAGNDTNDNVLDEYIELYNPTTQPISLQDTNGTWRLDGGIKFSFPSNTVVGAGATLLAANINPADAAALAAFRARYGLGASVPVLGPYSGKLSNRSDRVALEKPQYPDLPGDPYSWVIVDEVIYGNQTPWPTNANGGGAALLRISVAHSGNDPANWRAADPSPGSFQSGPTDSDGDGMPDDWELSNGLSPIDPLDAGADPDGDGLSNLEEFLAGTNPRDASSLLAFDRWTNDETSVILEFTAREGKSYTIQFTDDLDSGQWSALNTFPAGAARPVVYGDPKTSGPKYYRLVTPSL